MYPFKNYSFSWWQLGLLKIYMIAAGVLIGVYFTDLFSKNLAIVFLRVIFILPVIYLTLISLKQIKE